MDKHITRCTSVGVDSVNGLHLVGQSSQILQRPYGLVVDMGNDKPLSHTRPSQNAVRLNALHLDTALDLQPTTKCLVGIGEPAALRRHHIYVIPGEEFRFTDLITQSHLDLFHRIASFYRQRYFIVRTMLADLLLKRRGIIQRHPVD